MCSEKHDVSTVIQYINEATVWKEWLTCVIMEVRLPSVNTPKILSLSSLWTGTMSKFCVLMISMHSELV